EKPFAMSAAEARTMVDAAQRTRGLLIEGFHYRFHRMFRAAVELMRQGAAGQPLQASAGVHYPIPVRAGEPRWSPEHGGGAVMDLGCYGIHALRSLLGVEPRILGARSTR